MRRYFAVAVSILLAQFSLQSCAPASDSPMRDTDEAAAEFPLLSGPYLGQPPPGMEPELFAPGIVSTAGGEWSSTFTPDGTTFLFGYRGEPHGILIMEEIDGRWSEPRLAPFSAGHPEYDLNFSPDGGMLYFTSARPGMAPEGEERSSDLWVAVRGENGWGDAVNLGEPVNTALSELYPSVTEDGTLYFFVFDPFIAPDESYIIFASDRPDGFGGGDLHVSFRQDDGTWGAAINLGSTINSPQTDFCPSVTKDGKYLFFSSRRPYEGTYPNIALSYRNELDVEAENPGQNVDVYWVDAQILEQLREE